MDVIAENVKGDSPFEHLSERGLSPALWKANIDMPSEPWNWLSSQAMPSYHSRLKR